VTEEPTASAPDLAEAAASPRPVGTLRRTFVSLASRDFRYLTLGTIAEGFGMWGQQIAVAWLVYVLTGSAAQLGAVAFAGGLLALLLMPFGGILADRYPRRTIIVVSTLAGAAQSFALAFLVLAGLVEVWHVYAFAVLSSITMAANQPARQAYVFDVSTESTLANAVAMNNIAMNLARIVGPPLAGLLAAAAVGAPFVFVAGMRALASWATLRMTPQRRPVPTGRDPFRELLEGFRYLAGDSRLLGLLAINALPALLVYPYVSFLPLFASDVLGAGPSAYGALVAMIAVGSVVGLLLLAFLGDPRHKGAIMLAGFLAYLVLVVAFSRSELLVLSLAILIFAGVFHGIALALNTTLFQLAVRSDMRGRGMAVWQMAFSIMPVGALPMGLVIARFGPQDGVALLVLSCLALFVLIVVFWRSVRRL
jgi:MFS family permease